MLHRILDLIGRDQSTPPAYVKWEVCALYLEYQVFYVAYA